MKKDKQYKLNNVGLKGTKKSLKKDEGDDYPLFCFKHLSYCSFKKQKNKDSKFFIKFLKRLKDLSQRGWKAIRTSRRHAYGMESIPKNKIKKDLPACITPDTKDLDVFRADGDKHAFLGIQNGKIFRILFIEANFNDIYNH